MRVASQTQTSGREHFDVFICYNSADEEQVAAIVETLRRRGISPWFDKWELRPGLPWQGALEERIRSIGSAAIFVGKSGIGPWQYEELTAYMRQFIKRGCPVIPVILDGCPRTPELPVFLEGRTWVDFRSDRTDPLSYLIWGITGTKPEWPATQSPQSREPEKRQEG